MSPIRVRPGQGPRFWRSHVGAFIIVNAPKPLSPFGALHHVGIAVHDLDASAENIRALLNGRTIDEGVDALLGARWLWIEAAGSPIIEVVTSTGEGPIADYLSRHGPGLHHLSFQPASFDASLEHTKECGFSIVGENRDHTGYEEFFVSPELTGGALFHSFRRLAT